MTGLQEKSGKSSVDVQKATSKDQLQHALEIRYNVFVIGQNVPKEEEFDAFEEESFHYLATIAGTPCGAARWRFTTNGVKLERFAVLEKYRGNGVGSALVRTVLDDINENPDTQDKLLYLHAQLGAVKLYSNFGFRKEGQMFQECEIDHYKMVK
jgi:predicted GNAT family N-acyltransferase